MFDSSPSDDLSESPRRGAGPAGAARAAEPVPAAAGRHDARVPSAATAAVRAVRAAAAAGCHARAPRALCAPIPLRAWGVRTFPAASGVVRFLPVPHAGTAAAAAG